MKRNTRIFFSFFFSLAICILASGPKTLYAEETPSGDNTDGGSITLDIVHKDAQSLTLQLDAEHLDHQDVTFYCVDPATGKSLNLSVLASPGTSEYTLYDLETPVAELKGTLNISMITKPGYELNLQDTAFTIEGRTYGSGSAVTVSSPTSSVSSSVRCREMIPAETPEEPETPIQPDNPADPETPAQPEDPTQPETPAQPDDPAGPETPAQPDDPAQPETPAQPENPAPSELPAQPEAPAEPETPAEPGTPAEQRTSIQPETSTEQEQPGVSSATAETSVPSKTAGETRTYQAPELLTTTPITETPGASVPDTGTEASTNQMTAGHAAKPESSEGNSSAADPDSSVSGAVLSSVSETEEQNTGVHRSDIVRRVNLVIAVLILIVVILLLIRLTLTLKRENRRHRYRQF